VRRTRAGDAHERSLTASIQDRRVLLGMPGVGPPEPMQVPCQPAQL
jgi:hypothetical protein